MRKLLTLTTVAVVSTVANAQAPRGSVSGHITDSNTAVLQGALIQLQPSGGSAVSDTQGDFNLTGIAPGHYRVSVSYLGFAPFTQEIDVTANGQARVNAVLQVDKQSQVLTVEAGREFGEVAALNRERTAENIVQVLPSEVINSLPNVNIADAIGRMPSVSLERDEGEGKYVQIRGTEPRLSNVTVNGVHVPSPENVRNVKLDTIPADLVESIEVSKTLSASQDGDAIGGSVNMVTRSATDHPYFSVLGMMGHSPQESRGLDQEEATYGQRFGQNKKLGIMIGGSRDWNGRSINDIEPSQDIGGPPTTDLRNYLYDRSRWGLGGTVDYKLGEMSSAYVRGLFSHFKNFGEDWIYSPATDGSVSFSNVYRKPVQQIFSLQSGVHQELGTWLLNYEVALSQARMTGGSDSAGFDYNGPAAVIALDNSNPFVPKYPVTNGVNIYDPKQYDLSSFQTSDSHSFERDVVGNADVAKRYVLGNKWGTFQAGFKVRDSVKNQLNGNHYYSYNGSATMQSFQRGFSDPNYYFGQYGGYGPVTQFTQILGDFYRNPSQYSFNATKSFLRSVGGDFNVNERVTAGYLMNTISFNRFRLQTGVRFEGTTENSLAPKLLNNALAPTPSTANIGYVNTLPSVQLQYNFSQDTDIRFGYGIGISRPNFGDLAPYQTISDIGQNANKTIVAGNPNLKPTHAQNFDILVEHYLKGIGILQFGYFYKALSNPIYSTKTLLTTGQYAGYYNTQPVNGPSANLGGIEASWRQQLGFLPGALNGMGVSANYSYTYSRATVLNSDGSARAVDPMLLRDAPNNWNFDATYDKYGISARMGLTHNDAMIWSYSDNPAGQSGGLKGPNGDTYLFPHTQVDAQVSYLIPHGHGLRTIVSMLNLNNEVFGFYMGSEKYPIQREYYGPSISWGLRWVSGENSR
jgi:TonB-dependent receptor